MRPHIELVAERDLVWHRAELPGSRGRAAQRNLSYDEESGAASTKVRFRAAWSRPAGFHAADTEWFVLNGRVDVAGRTLGRHGYLRAPAGLRVPEMAADAGTEVLLLREYGDGGFTPSDDDGSGFVRRGGHDISGEPGELTLLDAGDLEWSAPPWDEVAGVGVKILYRDASPADGPQYGYTACLWRAPVGWADPASTHRAVFEEAYGLAGALRNNFGELAPGRYYHRPALVRHSAREQVGDEDAIAFVRLGGDAGRWVTDDPFHRVIGRAVNYDPDDPAQAILPAGIAVRSTTAGPEPVPEPTPGAGDGPPHASATVSNLFAKGA